MIAKEVRALLPAWTAAVLALVAGGRGVYPLSYLGVPLFFTAVAGMGAFSVGHEYVHGTLDSLLMAPVPRWRQWAAKTAVLLPMLATLAAIGASVITLDRGDRVFGTALFWLPALTALCVAPWMTMVTASPIAAAVFTLGLIGLSIAVGDWLGVSVYGFTAQVDEFRRGFMLWTLGALSAAGGLAGWLTFSRLQVAGHAARDLQLYARAAAPRVVARGRRPPLVALLGKELRLQQLAIGVAAVYTAGCIAVLLLRRSDVFGIFEVLMALYIISVPALIGALACAEERHFGTLDSQLLLPVAAPTQWLVKTATAVALALVLALLVPAALLRLFPASVVHVGPDGRLVNGVSVVMVLGSVSVSLYVSTLARSGMAALMYSVAAIPGFAYVISRVGSWTGERAYAWVHQARAQHVHHTMLFGPGMIYSISIFAVFVAAVIALALPNYRYADRRPVLVACHATVLMAGVIGYSVALNVMMALRY